MCTEQKNGGGRNESQMMKQIIKIYKIKDIYGNNKYTQWLQDIYNAMEESEKFLTHGE
jgi:hypothetical protein